jgi:hypothetical protein
MRKRVHWATRALAMESCFPYLEPGGGGGALTAEYGNIQCVFSFSDFNTWLSLIIGCEIWSRLADISVMFFDDVVNIRSLGNGLFDIEIIISTIQASPINVADSMQVPDFPSRHS